MNPCRDWIFLNFLQLRRRRRSRARRSRYDFLYLFKHPSTLFGVVCHRRHAPRHTPPPPGSIRRLCDRLLDGANCDFCAARVASDARRLAQHRAHDIHILVIRQRDRLEQPVWRSSNQHHSARPHQQGRYRSPEETVSRKVCVAASL